MADADAEAITPDPAPLSDEALSGCLEALLLMAEEPIATATLAEAVREPIERVSATLTRLCDFYDRTGRGFELRCVGGGWRFCTRAEHADLIARWVGDGRNATLSQAALETLAVIAYLQPITRGRVSAVRGVNVDGVIRTLTTRGLITESGVEEHSRAVLFATTPLFCEKMGLASLADLPPLAPHLPEAAELAAELASHVTPAESGRAAGDGEVRADADASGSQPAYPHSGRHRDR